MSKLQNLYGLKVSVSNIKKHEFYEGEQLNNFLLELFNTLKKYKGVSNYIDLQEDLRRTGASRVEIEAVAPFIFKSIGKYFDEDNKIKEREFEYKFYDFEADALTRSIKGRIHKEYTMFTNIVVEGELKPVPVGNNEIVDFYYSINDEKIIFYRKQRFGHKEIVSAVEAFLNHIVQKEYEVECLLIREGLLISELKNRIENEKDMVKLTLKYKVPNMPLKHSREFSDNTDKAFRDKMEEGNIKEVEETFHGYDEGIDGKSEIIADALEKAISLIPREADDYAISHKYLSASYERRDGTKESTESTKAKTILVDELKLKGSYFIETARSFISYF